QKSGVVAVVGAVRRNHGTRCRRLQVVEVGLWWRRVAVEYLYTLFIHLFSRPD
ncbi:hypothetical protein A2U01_0116810, partial [Trifolium medium]|nr:hypothetical protein [Trifolium medium]